MSSETEHDSLRMMELAKALADPLRLSLLEQLMLGPASVSQLVAVTGSTQSNVSNHLAVLRDGGLVKAASLGRQKIYELAGASVAQLVEALVSLSGGVAPARRATVRIAEARTCYDHLAGRLGVAVFDALVARGAVEPPLVTDPTVGRDRGEIALAANAERVFASLGVDLDEARRERRKLASYCIDWTEHRPHLSGALGAALWRRFLEAGWLARDPGSRGVLLTRNGRQRLRTLLGIDLPPATAEKG